MVGRNPTNANKGKGVDEQPLEPETLSPRTSTRRLLAVEVAVGEMNARLTNLQLTLEQVACQLEVGVNALVTSRLTNLQLTS